MFRNSITRIKKTSLLIAILIIILSAVLSYHNSFNWLYDDFSDLGLIFNLGLIISGLILLFFTKTGLSKIENNLAVRFLMVVASISLILTGVVWNNVNHIFHLIFASLFFWSFINMQLIYGIKTIKNNKNLGILSITISLFNYIIWGGFFLWKIYNRELGFAIPELIYLIFTFIWACIFTLYYN